jgi:hypothetical protein
MVLLAQPWNFHLHPSGNTIPVCCTFLTSGTGSLPLPVTKFFLKQVLIVKLSLFLTGVAGGVTWEFCAHLSGNILPVCNTFLISDTGSQPTPVYQILFQVLMVYTLL